MRAPPRDCPCTSGLRYGACCAPFHKGTAEAETPVALMRSRYAAFALGLGEYLVKTLAADHDDRRAPPHELARAFSSARHTQRFMGLRIVHAPAPPDPAAVGARAEVVFVATIFERGVDRSFAERSLFVRERSGWRYASGDILTEAELASLE